MRQLQRTFETIERITEEAVAYLRKYEPVKGYWLAFSGGKDSIVSRKLCDLAGVKYVAGYTRTGIDPPELSKFIKKHYPDTIWHKPEKSFYQLVVEKCPPMATTRWCCDYIKESPGLEDKRQYPLHVAGIRAEESSRRANKPRIDLMPKMHSITVKPIFHWKEYHIWEFIDHYCLPYPSLYDEGFDRIGCVVCPFMFHKNQSKLNMHRKRWPKMFRAFENAVLEWYEKQDREQSQYKTFETHMEAYYRGFE